MTVGARTRLSLVVRRAGAGIALCGTLAASSFSRPLARKLAGDPSLPGALLWLLSLHRWDVRAAIGAHPSCPRPLMRVLLYTGRWAVAAAIAANPAADARVVERIISVDPPRVRLYAAANPALTTKLADRLLADPDPYVRAVAAAHAAASAEALARLAGPMSEPAWTLRRIATHPSCPQDLSDQILTWLALGGAGDADPAFDPLECTGHPESSEMPEQVWYVRAAASAPEGSGRSCEHPLWRVRASVLRSGARLNGAWAWALARDPRPEVRRSIAAAGRLTWNIRYELCRDADPSVARAASMMLKRRGANPGSRRLVLSITGRVLVPLAFLAVGLVDSGFFSGGTPGSATGQGNGLQGAFTTALPGGGQLQCGMQAVDPGAAYVTITAGSKEITVLFPGGDATTFGGRVLAPPLAVIPAGQEAEYLLPNGPAPLTVLAGPPQGGPASTVDVVKECG